MTRKKLAIGMLFLTAVMSFIILYAGHFLFKKPVKDAPGMESGKPDTKVAGDKSFPVTYKHMSEEINGYGQEIHILEVDLSGGRAEIKPALSFNRTFGFENLSEIVQRSGAYAAINAGFFYNYGEPGGMVVVDGVLFTNSTGKYPVFIVENNRASLKELKLELSFEGGSGSIALDNINSAGRPGDIVLYTPVYGNSSRTELKSISAVIINNIVTEIGDRDGEVDIPENGMVLSFFQPVKYNDANIPIKKGDAVKLVTSPELSGGMQAYECGSWIVRDGKVVIGDTDEWVGVMTNHDPRTAVGLKEDGTVVLLVVDGRQPGFSAGFKGKELGDFLLRIGVTDAAMLDGGASSEMIVEGRIVNKPSYKGQERPLAGAIIVKVK